MNSATLQWILGIAGIIIMLLLSANGFWISRLIASIDLLREKLESLQLSAGHQEERFQACQNKCENHTEVVDERLNKHAETLKVHGEDIATLKERVGHARKA